MIYLFVAFIIVMSGIAGLLWFAWWSFGQAQAAELKRMRGELVRW